MKRARVLVVGKGTKSSTHSFVGVSFCLPPPIHPSFHPSIRSWVSCSFVLFSPTRPFRAVCFVLQSECSMSALDYPVRSMSNNALRSNDEIVVYLIFPLQGCLVSYFSKSSIQSSWVSSRVSSFLRVVQRLEAMTCPCFLISRVLRSGKSQIPST